MTIAHTDVEDDACPYALPSADVSGIGVILAFQIPAYICWIVIAAFYILGLIPQDILNNFDTYFIRSRPQTSSNWSRMVRKGVLISSTQQLVMGIAILSSEFLSIPHTPLIDFHVTIYLAWTSSVIHMSALTFLHAIFQRSMRLRVLRAFSMSILLVMLCAAIYPTTNFAWDNALKLRESCQNASKCPILNEKVSSLWQNAVDTNQHGELSAQGVFSYLLLISSSVWKMTTMFDKVRKLSSSLSRKPFICLEKILHRLLVAKRNIYYRIFLGIYMYLLATFDFASSFAFYLWIVLTCLGWATFQIFFARNQALPLCVRKQLDEWNFGQILPLLLLLLPLYSFAEYCFITYGNASTEAHNTTLGQGSLTGATPQVDHPPGQSSVNDPSNRVSNRKISELFSRQGPTDFTHRKDIHKAIYATIWFQTMLAFLNFAVIASTGGFFAQTIMAFIGPAKPFTFWTSNWHLAPALVSLCASLIVLFVAALMGPFLVQDLST